MMIYSERTLGAKRFLEFNDLLNEILAFMNLPKLDLMKHLCINMNQICFIIDKFNEKFFFQSI